MPPLLENSFTPQSQLARLERQKSEFLRKRGWAEHILHTYGLTFHPNTPESGQEPGSWHLKFHGQLQGYNYLSIPFIEMDGSPLLRHLPKIGYATPFIRVRLLDFIAVLGKDTGKYQTPAGGGSAIYVPRTLPASDIASNTTIDLYIVEGEFDAIDMVEKGYPCFGLSGVDGFLSKNEINPPLNHGFEWSGRKVYICFDQDAESTHDNPLKEGPAAALKRITLKLGLLGAKVYGLYIARTAIGIARKGSKVGPDDYLRVGGTKEDLLKTAELLSQDNPLLKMLSTYGMTLAGKVHNLEAESKGDLAISNFRALTSNIRRLNAEGKFVPVSKDWEVHPARPLIKRFILDADQPFGFLPGGVCNKWTDLATKPLFELDPDALEFIENYKKFQRLLWNEGWEWRIGRMAYLYQNPTRKVSHAAVITGDEGLGKSTDAEIHAKIIGPILSKKVSPEKFFHKFANHSVGKIWVYADEVSTVRKEDADSWKDMISGAVRDVEEKYQAIAEVENRANYQIATNHAFALKIAAASRRTQVGHVEGVANEESRAWFDAWIKPLAPPDDSNLTKEYLELGAKRRGQLLGWYLSQDPAEWGYDPAEPAPNSLAKSEMAEASKSERETEARGRYDMLPDIFILDKLIIDSYGVDKYILDDIKHLAPYRITARATVEGKSKPFTVYAKGPGLLVPTKAEMSKGKFIRDLLDRPSWYIREILTATTASFDEFTSSGRMLAGRIVSTADLINRIEDDLMGGEGGN